MALTDRLSSLQAPFNERLQAYEARIQELEREIQAKDEENRALILAKLETTQRQIRLEREAEEKAGSLTAQ